MKKHYFLFLLLITNITIAQTTKKVLFLGNSYTQYNNLPSLISQIANSTNDVLVQDSNLIGGYRFMDHVTNQTSLTKISANQWDYVVLQEQSQMPAFPTNYVNQNVFPYATQLANLAKQNYSCTVPIFYTTWGRQNGDSQICQNGECTYEVMDNLLQQRYRTMAENNKGLVSPVAQVWRYIRENHPNIQLYVSDQSHPSLEGSMAAAYTFYTIIYRKDPSLATFNATLNSQTATTIKNAVKHIVYNNLENYLVDVNDNFAHFTTNMITVNNVQFENETQNPTNIFWSFGDGTTSNQQNPTHTYTNNGSYTITLSLTVCGKRYTKTKQITISALSNEDFVFNDLKIYPNPTNEYLYLSDTTLDEIHLYDTSGRKINFLLENDKESIKINVGNLNSGTYIIKLFKNRKTYFSSFIKTN